MHAPAANPILVEVTRGALTESRYRGAFAVVDAGGHVALHAGDIEAAVYPRSGIKPLQALALLETGAADAFGLGAVELALAAASHGGEPRHVAAVRAWLARIGCSEADLECGPQIPATPDAARALLASGATAGALHNNCSGKHAGFLTVARHLGQPTAGYIRFEHAVQQRALGILEQMTGLDLAAAPRGIDGCGIPQYGLPLGNLALAMARLADPSDQPEARQQAAARIRRAIAAEPWMVAGEGRFDSRVTAAAGEAALVKIGAEGIYCAAFPTLGLGAAIKIDDGAARASEAVMAALLVRLGVLDAPATAALADAIAPVVYNRAGRAVGAIRVVGGHL